MLIGSNPELLMIGRKESGDPIQAFCIDDSQAMLKILNRMLTDFGIKVVGSAINGKDAISKLTAIKDTQPLDLITLDITMPEMDGMTALPEIVKLYPTTEAPVFESLYKIFYRKFQ